MLFMLEIGLGLSMLWRYSTILLTSFLLCGCASHIIRTPNNDGVGIGGQSVPVGSLSIGGRSVAQSDLTEAVHKACRNAKLESVEVRRNVGQGLVTVLTLGTVSPSTVYFTCAKEPAPPIP
jgi:hypothetical protein